MVYIVMLLMVVLCIIYFKWLYNKNGKTIPYLIIFIFYIIWALFSIVYIDFGTYISEQDAYSFFTGASLRLTFILLPFIILGPIFLKKKINKIDKNIKENNEPIKYKRIMTILSLIIIFYLLLNLVLSGIPLFSTKITNFNFYNDYSKLPFCSTIVLLLIPFFLFYFSIIFSDKNTSKFYKIYSIFFLLFSISYRLLLGEKFYPIFMYIFFYLTPFLYVYFKKNNNKGFFSKKIISLTITLFLSLIAIVFVKYYFNPTTKYDSLLERFTNRVFALQSHSFWGYDLYLQNNGSGLNIDMISNEIYSGLNSLDITDPNDGLTKIMYLVSKPSIVKQFLNRNVRFYFGYWTISIGCFGYILSFFFSIFIAYCFAFYSSKLYRAIRSKDIILLFFSSICFQMFYKYFNEPELSFIFSLKMVISTFILLFYDYIRVIIKKTLRR